MRKGIKIAGIALGGVFGLGVLGLVGLIALGFYLKSVGYTPSRARAEQPSAPRSKVPAAPSKPLAVSGRGAVTPSAAGQANGIRSAAPRTNVGSEVRPSRTPAAATDDAGATPSDLVAHLESLKAKGAYADLAELVFKGAAGFSNKDRAAAIAWLEPQERWGRVPVLFLLSRLHAAAGDLQKAAQYYVAASLAYRIDARCVRDQTARQAVIVMESLMTEVRSHLSKSPGEISGAIAWALAHEESIKDREPAYWIAAHGMGAFGGGQPGAAAFAEGEEREQVRAEVRKSFEGMAKGK